MRRPVLIVLLLAALATLASVLLLSDVLGGPVPPLPEAPGSPIEAPGAVAPEGAAAATPRSEPVAVAAPVAPRVPVDLADRVTAVLQIFDGVTGAPVPAAAVYRFAQTDEAAITYADANGMALLPLQKGAPLFVVRAGYLLRLAPTQLGTTAEAPQIVSLIPDTYGTRCMFRFRGPGGRTPEEVRVRFRPKGPDDGDAPMPAEIRNGDDVHKRAWYEHRTIAVLRAVPELHVQLGGTNASFVHLLGADDEVVFVQGGLFEFDAATADGLVARGLFDTSAVQQQALTVQMRRGDAIRGVVRAEDGAPVEGASITIVGSDPLRLTARTGRDGAFAIGPLADGSFGLDVRHRDHAVLHPGPYSPGPEQVAIVLASLPKTSVRGRLRAAGSRAPVAGARVTLIVSSGDPILATSEADGGFVLAATGTEAMRIAITADGCVPHGELVEPGTTDLEIELWPRDAETRCAAGLTAIVRGFVVDREGVGIAGLGIRYQPETLPLLGDPTRRVLMSGRSVLTHMATSGADGSFQLETAAGGPGTLSIAQAARDPGVRVTAVLGRRVDGVRMVTERRQ